MNGFSLTDLERRFLETIIRGNIGHPPPQISRTISVPVPFVGATGQLAPAGQASVETAFEAVRTASHGAKVLVHSGEQVGDDDDAVDLARLRALTVAQALAGKGVYPGALNVVWGAHPDHDGVAIHVKSLQAL
jgi:hypothetical protein